MYAPNSELGIYFNDTRYLGIWETTFNGVSPIALASELRFNGNTVVFSMSNGDFPVLGGPGRIPRDTFLIRRVMTLLGDVLYETLEIKNFDQKEHVLQIEQWAGGRFDDVFEVRGFSRPRRGRALPSEEFREPGRTTSVLRYEGLDGRIRRTWIQRFYEGEKVRVSPGLVSYFTRLRIPAKQTALLRTIVSFDERGDGRFCGRDFATLNVAEKMKLLAEGSEQTPFSPLVIETDNAIMNRAIHNAELDVFMLLTQETPTLRYPYAGIPWFSAPFGRDGLITAYQLLPWAPQVARGVLDYAFQTQGTKVDAFTDEQPGKIFHEMRRGEMSATREVPFIPYYGSVDSTPLALILLHEYVRWTMDLERLRDWWPHALKAIQWMDQWGAVDRDGFVGYAMQSSRGLVNQGWKDSSDSIMHADGRLARAPIRLCEVQGYAYRAKLGMSSLALLLGEHQSAERFRRQVLEFRARFLERFWNPAGRYIHLAIDGDGRECAVRSSNMGHCLWSGILHPEHARGVADHLLSDAMFSGYGIRTLADGEVAYNPLSYHNGSVWPHDNSLIMEGFGNYGFTSELERLAQAMIEVLESSEDFRLPELFCGFRRRGNAPPVPYQVACKPQAWSAGSVFLMLKAMLGISMETDQSYLVFNFPTLASKMESLEIKNLRARDWEMDLRLRQGVRGAQVDVIRTSGVKPRIMQVR